MSKYRVLQLTNNTVGAVTVGSALPLGIVTRKICANNCPQPTFTVGSSTNNAITVNEAGYYHITYTGSLIAGATGVVTASLVVNGVTLVPLTVSSASAVSGATVNVVLDYVDRVYPSCCSNPNTSKTYQIILGGVAVTDGTSNIVVERVY